MKLQLEAASHVVSVGHTMKAKSNSVITQLSQRRYGNVKQIGSQWTSSIFPPSVRSWRSPPNLFQASMCCLCRIIDNFPVESNAC